MRRFAGKGPSRRILAGAIAMVGLLAPTGCLRDPSVIVVGSKAFTEGAILGYVELLALAHAGFAVEDRIDMGPTLIVRQALLAGEIDTYMEYTGTALVNFFHVDDPALLADPHLSYRDAARLDQANHLTWLRPWALNDTYTVLMTRAEAARLHVRTLSDLARIQTGWTMGSDPEFAVRADGLPGLLARYGLHPEVRQMDAGLIYRALEDGLLDAAIGYSTDGRIAAMNLVRLKDDRHYFPSYHPAPVFRDAAVKRFGPRLASVLDPIGAQMTNDEITHLNYEMDVRHASAKALAREWLQAHIWGFHRRRPSSPGSTPDPTPDPS